METQSSMPIFVHVALVKAFNLGTSVFSSVKLE